MKAGGARLSALSASLSRRFSPISDDGKCGRESRDGEPQLPRETRLTSLNVPLVSTTSSQFAILRLIHEATRVEKKGKYSTPSAADENACNVSEKRRRIVGCTSVPKLYPCLNPSYSCSPVIFVPLLQLNTRSHRVAAAAYGCTSVIGSD